jgi:hypothetical protein
MSSELVMDQRVVWNKFNKKEVEQAKKMLMDYKRKGYELLKSDGTVMQRFSPILEEVKVMAKGVAKSVMKILTDVGDERLVWDKDNGREAKQAKKKFLELLKKGYTAFSVDHASEKNRKITEFDIDAEEIMMVPETVKG